MRVTANARQATRHRILEAAVTLFADVGWDAATTRDIAIAARIATGTLFNYFPTKEAIAATLTSEAMARATEEFQAKRGHNATPGMVLEEDLFLFVWTGLRHLAPYRRFIGPALGGILSPLALVAATSEAPTHNTPSDASDIPARHMETVAQIMAEHGIAAPSPFVLQLYWSLYLSVLAHWIADPSPHQEDTLALLDQSLILLAATAKKIPSILETGLYEVDDPYEGNDITGLG
jgi:AcrR family transcriptional regulator